MPKKFARRSYREWISSLPVLLLLLIVILASNGEQIHAQLLKMGELIWHDYFTLRADIPTPTCHPKVNLDAELKKLEAEANDLDGLEALFEAQPFNRQAALISLQRNQALCLKKHHLAEQNQARITTPVIIFRTFETCTAAISLFAFEKQRMILILMLFICAFTCTVEQHHIAFKPVITRQDNVVSTTAQLLGNLILLLSAGFYRESLYQSDTVVDHPELYFLLVLGFAVLSIINLYQLTQSKQYPHKKVDKWIHALLAIPLYIFMAFFAGGYFFLIEGHWAGLAIFFSSLFDQAGLFLNIGLYIWIGMLLKRTQLGELVFKIFIPWRMSPELLAFVAIIVMAVPTAYTGASGIIIIAMGAIVYKELRRVGARRQLALAATAMTGSAGVVLRPCLLVVLIAALNKEVVTDQLFEWGLKTFITTVTLFFIFTLISKREKIHLAPVNEAFKPFLRTLPPLFPYISIVLLVSLAYYLFLNVYMDEFSAPIILPVIILSLIAYEAIFVQPSQENSSKSRMLNFEHTVRMASSDASIHIGALLLLMGLSFVLGGVIERSGLLNGIPDTFSSIWMTLGFLVIVLVGIGMIMEPFGAVVLVSGTVAQIAYKNGINPIHFWMITLVSFELGYLTPPVALNHLLTRQMMGHQEISKAKLEGDNFWYRHEKILLPLVTMGSTLLLVAIVPVL